MKYRPGCTPVQAVASLREALAAFDQAQNNVVLWFAEIHRRRLFRQLGYSSMNQFAEVELEFSRTRIGDFLHLSTKLQELPEIRRAISSGKLGYSKAREIIRVATPKTQKFWVAEAADSTRILLREKIKMVREKAQQRRLGSNCQPELTPAVPSPVSSVNPGRKSNLNPDTNHRIGNPSGRHPGNQTNHQSSPHTDQPTSHQPSQPNTPHPAIEVPIRVTLEMSPPQFARYEALLEKLQKMGRVTAGPERVTNLLDGLQALVEADSVEAEYLIEVKCPVESKTQVQPIPSNSKTSSPRTSKPATTTTASHYDTGARRRAPIPPATSHQTQTQIHVHKCPDCGRAAVQTSRGEMAIDDKTFQQISCDARINRKGQPNKATIPPSMRRNVLARDRHHCKAPGCRHIHHLEVHHIKPRNRGGENKMNNLITLCSGCHRIWHKKGGPPPGWLKAVGE